MSNTVCMGRVCYGPSLCRPTLLWAEFAMGRVWYGPRCPVTQLVNFISEFLVLLVEFLNELSMLLVKFLSEFLVLLLKF